MSDEKQLMAASQGKMRMDDIRTGLSPTDIVIWKMTHRDTKYADIPTAQEVKDYADGPHDELTKDDIPATEEQKLRRLLTCWCKAIMEYFCGVS